MERLRTNYSDYKKRKEEEQTERESKFGDGLKILAAVGIGAGICGYAMGRKHWYIVGVQHGYIKATNDIIDAANGLVEELRKSRGK